METKVYFRLYMFSFVFKSYYVVWKQKKEKTTQENKSLNRTM